ncbi:MAG: T9SS type A sorting domain-containing protein [Bacteroidetes bacterium]|nr:MAG: T9SS type A sorting domain-containing protein [Bacteroidota bacterium]
MTRTIAAAFFIAVLSGAAVAQSERTLHREDREQYDRYFEQAGAEFSVPADLLRGLSFAETRWTHMVWAPGDSVSMCSGMPRVHGVMGLWDNGYFGFSLRDAARLIGRTPQELKDSPLQNIRGAAALLRQYRDERPVPDGVSAESIESWQYALAAFSGFPQNDIAQRRGAEVFSVLASGYQRDRITIRKRTVDLDLVARLIDEEAARRQERAPAPDPERTNAQPDYPPAKWDPAYSGNFGTQLIQRKFVVIHDVEGSYLGCISWFKNPSAQVSAHYVLNSNPYGVNFTTKAPNGSPDAPVGEVTQMVEEKYRAWHVGCWNSYMVGIEHEGYYNVTGWYTPECFDASAKLVRSICDRNGIPKDRNHVIAHQEWQNATWKSWVNSTGQGFDPTCNTHIDPGSNWNWTSFMALVTKSDTVRPVITAALPRSDRNAFPVYKDIVVTFNTPMDVTSANAAFSVIPSVTGTKTWNDDNTVLTFNPSSNLAWATSYTVNVDTSAKNIAKSRNLGTTPYTVSFTTVPLDTAGPAVLSTYPSAGQSGIFTAADVAIMLDEAVQTSSLSATVKVYDPLGASVGMANARNDVVNDRSVVSFAPANMKPNSTYTVKLLPGVKDMYGNASAAETVVPFTTGPEVVTAGSLLDNLDANTKGWTQPAQTPASRSIDTNLTMFLFTTEKVRSGSSARLSYAFTADSGGIAAVSASGFPPLDLYSSVGIWVSGDAGGNTLQFIFAPGEQVIDAGPVNWRGWKFHIVPLAGITGTFKKPAAIRLLQQPGGRNEGTVYFDEMQLNASITSAPEGPDGPPMSFALGQNFPNPFNPATTIRFSVGGNETVPVSLTVYDAIGRDVAALLRSPLTPGDYTVRFDAAHLPTGVYYYRLTSGARSAVGRMMLIK